MTRNLMLAAAATAASLLAGEFAVRLIRPQIFPVHPPGMYTLDDDTGYGLTPSYSGVIERAEFQEEFTVDERGLRTTTPLPRDPVLRILTLGDSQTFGFGVADEETFSSNLAAALSRRGIDGAVFNAGVPGYGTADQRNFLRSRIGELAPDIVVVQFLPVNDFVESRSPAVGWAALEEGMLAHGDLGSDDPSLFTRLRSWQKRHSHLATLISENLGYAAMRAGLMPDAGSLLGEDFTVDDAARVRELLVEIVDIARANDARTLLLYTTSKAQVIGERYVPPRSIGVVSAAAGEADVPWLDVTPLLRARDDRLDVFFRLDGHWTPAGHRAIAEIVAEELERLGWLGEAGTGSVAERLSPAGPGGP